MKVVSSAGLTKLIQLIKATFIPKTDVEAVSELTVDSTPASGSSNLITSGGVYTGLSGKAASVHTHAKSQITDFPTNVSAFTNDAGYLTQHQSLEAYRTSAEQDVIDNALDGRLDTLESYVPSETTASNKLADKAFVNSSISTNTATFRGTSVAGLTEEQFLAWANGLTKTNNDYVFWNTTDTDGNVLFKRYKYNGTNWVYEYSLNNSSFTASQWAAINSGVTSSVVSSIAGKEDASNKVTSLSSSSTDTQYPSAKCTYAGLATKQNVIDSSHKLPAANVSGLATVATSGSYNDLSNKPTNVSAFTNDAGYLTQHQSLSAYRTASAQDIIDAGKVDGYPVTISYANYEYTADKTNAEIYAAHLAGKYVYAVDERYGGVYKCTLASSTEAYFCEPECVDWTEMYLRGFKIVNNVVTRIGGSIQPEINDDMMIDAEYVHYSPSQGYSDGCVGGALNRRMYNTEEHLYTGSAYQRVVPDDAKAVAVDGIGGKTVVYNQLLNPSTYEGTKSASGVTMTYNNDGTYTVSGTATATTVITIATSYHFVPNHKYFLSAPQSPSAPQMQLFNATTGSVLATANYATGKYVNLTHTATDSFNIRFIVYNGTTYSGIEIPQLFDLTAMGADSTVTDETTAKSFLRSQGINPYVYNAYSDNTLVSANVTDATSKDSDNTVLGTYTIPQSLRTAYPLRSAGSVYDEYDMENKKFIQRVGTVDLGSLSWTRDSGAGVFTATLSDAKPVAYNSIVGNLLCAIYSADSATNVYGSASTYDQCIAVNKIKTIMVSNSNYSDAASFKTAMNGVMLQYELATPTEVDISSYLTEDNVLTVEAGGTLTFTQSNTQTVNIPIPNEMVFSVNPSLTSAQLMAINSGITKSKVLEIDAKEDETNKVTSLSSSSTDIQYPSAKCVYDSLETKSEVSGTNDGTYWQTLTIDGTTKHIPDGGAGGNVTWGNIVGPMSNQVDLTAALDGKTEAFPVTLSWVDYVWTADKTNAEIYAAYSAGKYVYASMFGIAPYRCTKASSTEAYFSEITYAYPTDVSIHGFKIINDVVISLNLLAMQREINDDARLPAEYVSYDARNTDVESALTNTFTQIANINAKIPTEATSSNQLADKSYVGTQISAHHDSTKQDTISDLATIRSNASSGASKVSCTDETVGGYGYTKNTGTITGINMNGASKGTSGVVDLGTVLTSHQDISGKENASNKVTSISSASTDTEYPSAKCVYDLVGNIESALAALR